MSITLLKTIIFFKVIYKLGNLWINIAKYISYFFNDKKILLGLCTMLKHFLKMIT